MDKRLLKQLLKESLKEILEEEGLLAVLKEGKEVAPKPSAAKQEIKRNMTRLLENNSTKENKSVNEVQKRMQQELRRSGLLTSAFDPFAGTTPMSEAQASGGPQPGPLGTIDPQDKGVDISGIMNLAAGKWKAHMGGKSK